MDECVQISEKVQISESAVIYNTCMDEGVQIYEMLQISESVQIDIDEVCANLYG